MVQSLRLFYFIFVEFTSARNPSDYCNHIESPPAYLINLTSIDKFEFQENAENSVTLADLPFVSQNDTFNIVEQTASSSVVDKGKTPIFD